MASRNNGHLHLGSTPSHGNPPSNSALNTELNNVARNTDDVEKARRLVAAGADLSSTNGSTWRHTPLHQAAYHGRLEMARTLVALGAPLGLYSNPCGRGQHGTPLELARGGGHHAIASIIENALKSDGPTNDTCPTLMTSVPNSPAKSSPVQATCDIQVQALTMDGSSIALVEASSEAKGAVLKKQILEAGDLKECEESYRLVYKQDIVREFEPVRLSGLTSGQEHEVVLLVEPISGKSQFLFSGITPGPRKAFDQQGLLYWLGTRRGSEDYGNPAEKGIVKVEWSSTYKGPHSAFVDNEFNDEADTHDGQVFNRGDGWHHTNYGPGEHWMRVDLGVDMSFRPDHYCLRHGSSGKTGPGAWDLRKWHLQGTNDDSFKTWTTLHTAEGKLVDGECGAWPVSKPMESFRYFRILMHAHDHGGQWLLALGGIELYGERVDL